MRLPNEGHLKALHDQPSSETRTAHPHHPTFMGLGFCPLQRPTGYLPSAASLRSPFHLPQTPASAPSSAIVRPPSPLPQLGTSGHSVAYTAISLRRSCSSCTGVCRAAPLHIATDSHCRTSSPCPPTVPPTLARPPALHSPRYSLRPHLLLQPSGPVISPLSARPESCVRDSSSGCQTLGTDTVRVAVPPTPRVSTGHVVLVKTEPVICHSGAVPHHRGAVHGQSPTPSSLLRRQSALPTLQPPVSKTATVVQLVGAPQCRSNHQANSSALSTSYSGESSDCMDFPVHRSQPFPFTTSSPPQVAKLRHRGYFTRHRRRATRGTLEHYFSRRGLHR